MVKDECDIIELFVRINARAVDHFFIVDNGSADSTVEILKRLSAEGFPITLSSDASIDHPQERVITALARQIAVIGEYDWIFPLDADEFIQADKSRLAAALASVPVGCCARINWATFVPTSDQYFSCDNPLWIHFRQRPNELRQYSKVIIPSGLAAHGFLTAGSHDFKRADKKSIAAHLLDIVLAHVPVRSTEQLISKSLIGSHKLSIKQNRRANEGFHWDVIAREVRQNNFSLGYSALRKVALSYALAVDDPVADELLPESRIGVAEDCIRHPELARINLLARCDAFMTALCGEIKKRQGKRRRKFWFF